MSLRAKGNHKLYNTWNHMKDRCYNSKSKAYESYGGREITICDRWLDSFENFVFDMGDKPTPEHSIDRINNDGNYTPSNCRWATRQQQARNTRKSKYVDYKGKRWLARELAEANNIDPDVFIGRLYIMDVERALEIIAPKTKNYKITAHGKTLTVNQWSKELSVSPSTIARRLDAHSPDKALDKNGNIRFETIVNRRKVEQLTKTGEHVAYYDSLTEAGKLTNTNFKNIQSVCKGIRITTGGYKWDTYKWNYTKHKQ